MGENRANNNNNNNKQSTLYRVAKDLEKKNKMLWTSMLIIIATNIIALIAGILASAFLMPEGPLQLISIILICGVFLAPCFYALKIEVSVGAYKCKKCGYRVNPTYKEALLAMHFGFTRYLKCPRCDKRTWCKKILKL